MTDASVFSGHYYDGVSAAAQDARVAVTSRGLLISTAADRIEWRYADIERAPGQQGAGAATLRLANRAAPDALVILPAAAREPIDRAAPGLLSGRADRRRMTALIGGLIAGSAAVAAALFIGVPAVSGPLAHATPKGFETQIGENLAAQINAFIRPCGDDGAMAAITPVIDEMAAVGEVGFDVRFRFVRMTAPNAFALPGGYVMATTGLLEAVGEDQEAFLAVMAHELGHVRARDGMRAVYRNAGLGILLEVITGGSGAAQQAVLVSGQLNQLRHTRRQETQADETAAQIMTGMDLDPAALARAFEAITGAQDDGGDGHGGDVSIPAWLSTHPDTEKRIDAARGLAREPGPLPLSAEDWTIVRNACNAPQSDADQD